MSMVGVEAVHPAKISYRKDRGRPMLTKPQLAHRIRQHVERELLDDSCALPLGTAIYSLSDPRDIRTTRYIGQTSNPRRRFLQHLTTARLWVPEECPWWVRSPRLRPLYDWLRELYREEYRLPTMVIHSWTATTQAARLAERARIYESLVKNLPVLNVEREMLRGQRPLL
jgi:hypothetical protein